MRQISIDLIRIGCRTLLLAIALAGSVSLQAQHQHRPLPAPSPDPLDADPQPFDIVHYAPTLDLRDAPDRTMSGVSTITFVWRESGDAPTFRFHLRDLEIDSIFYRDEMRPTPVRVEHQTISVPDSASYHHAIELSGLSVSPGDSAQVEIYYHGEMTDEFGPGRWGGVSSSNNVLYAMGVGFLNNYVSTTQHWMPCYDHPSDKATFTGRFRIPEGMRVASNGLLTSVVDEEDGSQTWNWHHVHPASTYLLTFAVSDYIEIELGTPELPMPIFSKRSDSAATHTTFSRLPDMVTWYGDHFGPYPFEKVGYVNTPQGAMEHQTMVSFPSALSRRASAINLTGAHELAHQWFGDLVSPEDFRHAWLNESFATFSEALWLERDGDFEGYLAGINGKLLSYVGNDVVREGVLPLYDFPRESPSSNYPATIYNKGAVVVGMLRYEMGEARFFEAMRSYLDTFAYSTATTSDMQRICEEVSERDLDFFFDQWVRRPGWPVYDVRLERLSEPGAVSVAFTQIQDSAYGIFTGVSVDVGFLTPGGRVNRTIRIDSAEQTFSFSIGSEVESLLFNQGPNLRTLAQFSMVLTGVESTGKHEGTLPWRLATNGDLRELRSLHAVTPREVQVGIYGTNGSLVTSYRVDSFPHLLETSSLPSGPYVLQVVEGGEEQHTIPFIITR